MHWFRALMVREPIFGPTAVLAAVFVTCYAVRCYRQGKEFDLQAAVIGVIACAGIVGGCLMMASTIFPGLEERISDVKLYLLLGGGSVVWVSFRAIKQVFRGQA